MKRAKYISPICLILLYLITNTGCNKSSDSTPTLALPPSTSMDMEGLSNFSSKKKSTLVSSDSTHFKKAWKFVHNWDSISVKLVFTPKLIFKEALKDKSSVYDDVNKQWAWTYTKNITGDGSYLATLTGKIDNDSVNWVMTVSRVNGDGLYNFKWIEGRTDIKQTGGRWKLYDPISNGAYLLINWKRESDIVKWIKYTNICETDPNKGNFIKYGTTNDIDYNAYIDITSNCPDKTAKIEWNTNTYAGRIIYESWTLGWDSSLKNLDPVQND